MANEKRLIDAKALAHKFLLMPGHYRKAEIDLINSEPTVDAVEVVHGRWKNKQTNSIFTWHLECSVCGTDYHIPVGYNYCPNCGAKMDGGSEI